MRSNQGGRQLLLTGAKWDRSQAGNRITLEPYAGGTKGDALTAAQGLLGVGSVRVARCFIGQTSLEHPGLNHTIHSKLSNSGSLLALQSLLIVPYTHRAPYQG